MHMTRNQRPPGPSAPRGDTTPNSTIRYFTTVYIAFSKILPVQYRTVFINIRRRMSRALDYCPKTGEGGVQIPPSTIYRGSSPAGALHTPDRSKAGGSRNVHDDQPCAQDALEHTQAGACNFDYKPHFVRVCDPINTCNYKPHEDSVLRNRMP